MNKYLKIGLLGCFLTIIFSSVLPKNLNPAKEKNMPAVEEKVLQPAAVTRWIETASQKALTEKDPYQRTYLLSMPLLASAYLEEISLYEVIAVSTKQALSKIPVEQNSRKAWLLGRYLAAENLLTKNSPAVDALAHQYAAWGWGYLANANEATYHATHTAMMQAAFDLTKNYQKNKTSKEINPKKIADDLSSLLWVWVLNLQAAANADDGETYQQILAHIQHVTHKKSIAGALSTGIPDTDYQAWALSIVYFSAKKMDDEDLSRSISPALTAAMNRAEKGGEKLRPAFVLAQSNTQAENNKIAQQENTLPRAKL
jgi:hypothetical protein